MIKILNMMYSYCRLEQAVSVLIYKLLIQSLSLILTGTLKWIYKPKIEHTESDKKRR